MMFYININVIMYYITCNLQYNRLIETQAVDHIIIISFLKIYHLIKLFLYIFYLLSIFKFINMIFLDKNVGKAFK